MCLFERARYPVCTSNTLPLKFAQCVLYKLHFNTLTFAMASIYSSTEDITNTKDIRESILRSGLRADPLNGLELHRNAREWRHFLPHLVKKTLGNRPLPRT